MQSVPRVGCVRGLAVVLGVGAAIAASGSVVASAEPAEPASPSEGASTPSGATSRPAATSSRGGTRVGSRIRGAEPASAATVPARNNRDSAAVESIPDILGVPAEQTDVPAKTSRSRVSDVAETGPLAPALTSASTPPPPPTRAPDLALTLAPAPPAAAPQPVQSAIVAAPQAAVAAEVAPAAAQPAAVGNGLAALPGTAPTPPVESPISWLVLGAATRALSRPRFAVPPAATTTTGLTTTPKTAANAAADPFATFIGGLLAMFDNKAPAMRPTQTGQGANGVVTGTLGATDPDSSALTYTVVGNPTHGTAAVAADGTFTYTPNPAAGVTGVTDSFRVSVSDVASGRHFHGFAGLIHALTGGLFGEAGHTSTATVNVTVAPFNNLPTGYAVVSDPDPTTGAVTGSVIGKDTDGDPLTFSGPTDTAKGAVNVTATGQFSYQPSKAALDSAAAPNATAADRLDVFSVTIDDGRGGVVTIPVTVKLVLAEELSTFCGCTLMPANTIFHADVQNLPVLDSSDTWVDLLGGTLRVGWGGTPWMGSVAGMPVNVVSAGHPTEMVIFNRGYSTSGPSIDDRSYAIPDRPLVEGMPDVPAWDRHLLVFQEGTCISQELYNVANGVELPAAGIGDALANAAYAAIWGSSWIAEAGVHYDMGSPLYPEQGWANASQLPYLPLILRPDELQNGSIDHMLGIVIGKDKGTGHAWPARSGDGTGTNPDGVPMGTVFRLDADFDISGYDPAAQVILRALQQHGAVVYDSMGVGEVGAKLLVMSNGWEGTDYTTAQRQLNSIPIDAFEAVDVLSIAADPDVGWLIQSTTV